MATVSDKKKKRIAPALDNPVEAIRDLASGVVSDASSVPSDLAENAFQQIFGAATPPSGDLTANQDLELNKIREREKILSYQKQRETIEKDVFSFKESVQVKQEIDRLLKELKLLASSTQKFTNEVAAIAMQEMPVNPGTYHINFFEWLIRMIKSLREKVEDSSAWLKVFTSRKGQKQYWQMFKKHGTSFSLSGERVIATQAG